MQLPPRNIMNSEELTLTEGHHFHTARMNEHGEVVLQLDERQREALEQTLANVFHGRDNYDPEGRGSPPQTDLSETIHEIVHGENDVDK